MKTVKARVCGGRLVVNEPTELPEGTSLDLVIADGGDELSAEERAALHAALAQSWASAQAGDIRPAEEILRELKARK